MIGRILPIGHADLIGREHHRDRHQRQPIDRRTVERGKNAIVAGHLAFSRPRAARNAFRNLRGQRDGGLRLVAVGAQAGISEGNGILRQYFKFPTKCVPNWVFVQTGVKQQTQVVRLAERNVVRLQDAFKVLLDTLLCVEAGRIVVRIRSRADLAQR